jgi:hypothetical protein
MYCYSLQIKMGLKTKTKQKMDGTTDVDMKQNWN